MKYKEKGVYIQEDNEPAFRSCPECNPAHAYLMNAEYLCVCFVCGRYWIHGCYLDSFENEDEMDAFLKEHLENTPEKGG